jgi:hypothetical protein
MVEIGAVKAAFLAAFISCSSLAASANPNKTSANMPPIKTHQPIVAFDFCRLKSSLFENHSFSFPFSSQSPIRTITPPDAAMNGQAHVGSKSETRQNHAIVESDKFIFLKWMLPCSAVVLVWIFIMFFATPIENLFFKWRDKKHPQFHPPIIH